MHVYVCVLAPTYIPRNFRVIQPPDGSIVQFAWDPPLGADELNIRGALKAYQVRLVTFDRIFSCMSAMIRLNCFDLLIPIIRYVSSRIFHPLKHLQPFLMHHPMVKSVHEFELKRNVT